MLCPALLCPAIVSDTGSAQHAWVLFLQEGQQLLILLLEGSGSWPWHQKVAKHDAQADCEVETLHDEPLLSFLISSIQQSNGPRQKTSFAATVVDTGNNNMLAQSILSQSAHFQRHW